MPSITKDQQDYRKLAQLSQILYNDRKNNDIILDDLLQIDDVNLRILSNKKSKGVLINGTPLHIAGRHKHIKAFSSLLNRGADFTAKNKKGRTVVHQAFYDMFLPFFEYETVSFNTLENELINLVLMAHVKFGNSENPLSADGLSHFHVACAFNHIEVVQLFSRSGLNVNESVNAESSIFPGYTPLHFAARFACYETVNFLLENQADIRAKDSKGLTPFHVAVERITKPYRRKFIRTDIENTDKHMEEKKKIIRLFMTDDRVENIDSMGLSKIHVACTLNDTSLVERLLQDVNVNCAINMDSPMWPGFTALHFAIRSGNIEIVKLLLKNGANFEAEDVEGDTPLDIFVKNYNLEELHHVFSAVPFLQNISFSDNKTKLSDFIDAMQSLSTFDDFFQTIPKDVHLPKNCFLWRGYSPLHLMVQFSEVFGVDKVELYLTTVGNMMIQQDSRGRTPLHLAFYQMKIKIVDLFFRHGLVVDQIIDDDGLSHLHIACAMADEDGVRVLLSQGAKINATYKGKSFSSKDFSFECCIRSGSTPLHFAISIRCEGTIVKILLENGADVNATNSDDLTPLHQLIYIGGDRYTMDVIKEISDLLLSSSNLVNIVSRKTGLSHIHIACYVNNENAAERLLQLGADPNSLISCEDTRSPRFYEPNISHFSGYTPLHFAVEIRHIPIRNRQKLAEILLRGGADILRKKPNGMTLFYDVLSTHWEVKNVESKFFMSMIVNDAALQKRAEEDCGLTLLHLACHFCDVVQIEKLLIDPHVDVNAQIYADSPIWPKATALDLLIETFHEIEDLKHAMKLLLDHGANVMMINDQGDTSVHRVWNKWYGCRRFPDYDILRLLLRYHRNFNVNPDNIEGITHFHMACFVSEFAIVEKFLENGIDVNLPIDYRHKNMTFQTPLQFMMESLYDPEARLQTIDVLLKYGADVSVLDENGSTPLFEVARRDAPRELFFKKLYEAGVNINNTNIDGESVLEVILKSQEPITDEELQFLFEHPNLFNNYNTENGVGIISLMLYNPTYLTQDRRFILEKIMNITSLFTVDQIGRTPIHNMVANHRTDVSPIEYCAYIERFIKMGYEIDAQDVEGKTALHLAIFYGNEHAVAGLLIAGVDINVFNNSDRTVPVPLEYYSRGYNNLHVSTNDKTRVENKIAVHITAMMLCELELHFQDNFQLINVGISEEQYESYCEDAVEEFEMTKTIKIGTGSLTVRDFLSETGAVASRPMMASETDRQAVEEFFNSIDHKRFPHLISVLKLQYRKSLIRLRSMEDATHSVSQLLGSVNGFYMPELCCRMIIRFLTNTEVKRLIMSMYMN